MQAQVERGGRLQRWAHPTRGQGRGQQRALHAPGRAPVVHLLRCSTGDPRRGQGKPQHKCRSRQRFNNRKSNHTLESVKLNKIVGPSPAATPPRDNTPGGETESQMYALQLTAHRVYTHLGQMRRGLVPPAPPQHRAVLVRTGRARTGSCGARRWRRRGRVPAAQWGWGWPTTARHPPLNTQ